MKTRWHIYDSLLWTKWYQKNLKIYKIWKCFQITYKLVINHIWHWNEFIVMSLRIKKIDKISFYSSKFHVNLDRQLLSFLHQKWFFSSTHTYLIERILFLSKSIVYIMVNCSICFVSRQTLEERDAWRFLVCLLKKIWQRENQCQIKVVFRTLQCVREFGGDSFSRKRFQFDIISFVNRQRKIFPPVLEEFWRKFCSKVQKIPVPMLPEKELPFLIEKNSQTFWSLEHGLIYTRLCIQNCH